MYCDRCGNRLMESEKYCPNCGNEIQDNVKDVLVNNDNNKSTGGIRNASIILGGLSFAGEIFWMFAPVSLILSIIGLTLAIKSNKTNNNKVGIILNAVGLFLSLVTTCIIVIILYFTDKVDGLM